MGAFFFVSDAAKELLRHANRSNKGIIITDSGIERSMTGVFNGHKGLRKVVQFFSVIDRVRLSLGYEFEI